MSSTDVTVLLIIHRRAEFTRRVFDAVASARPRRLLIAADGPADNADRPLCEATREVVARVDWDCDVRRDYSAVNLGVDRRVESALAAVFADNESAIVLEDDCVPSPQFFTFCRAMLDRYSNDRRIVHVSGETYRREPPSGASYYFSKYPLAWGWATWRRTWEGFDPLLSSWPRFAARPEGSLLFDTRDEERYWRETFAQQHELAARDRSASWDYAWYFACMTQGLSIHPGVNLVSNVGFDSLATHTAGESPLSSRPVVPLDDPLRHPEWILRDRAADLETFDSRFPGGILKQQRTVRHQLGRPFRWLRRQLPGTGRSRT